MINPKVSHINSPPKFQAIRYISYYPMMCSTVHGTLYVNHHCPLERGANNDIHEAHGTL